MAMSKDDATLECEDLMMELFCVALSIPCDSVDPETGPLIDPLPKCPVRGRRHIDWRRLELGDGHSVLEHVPDPGADFSLGYAWDEFERDRLAARHTLLYDLGLQASMYVGSNQILWACLWSWRHPDPNLRRAFHAASSEMIRLGEQAEAALRAHFRKSDFLGVGGDVCVGSSQLLGITYD
jgi:hypothetical protein